MMMRTIREKTRWGIVLMAVAFAAWLAFEGIQGRERTSTSGSNPVIAVVNGQQIRYNRWRRASSIQIDRAQAGKGSALTDEETRQAEADAWEAMIREILIEQEIERIGIEVSDAEITQAFRLSPPPDLIRNPAFQTDGRFDYAKYQAFFADPSVDEQLLRSIEQYYRAELPRRRLQQQLMSGVAVSDQQAWEEFEAQNETAVVTYVTVDPAAVVSDTAVDVSEEDARAYYRAHPEEFERPATATVRLASFSTVPGAADTTRVHAHADSIRTAILEGPLTFAAAAEEFSADTASAARGGEVGRFTPEDLVEPISSAVAGLDAGEISEPLTTPAGIQLLQVTELSGDTATVARIVLPIRLSRQGEDALFGRMDRFEGIALEDGLAAAGDSLGIEITEGATVTEGFDFVPGAGSLGVGVDWALQERTEIGELSEFFENGSGFHILELVDRTEAGQFEFERVREQIDNRLEEERRMEGARAIAAQAIAQLPEADVEALAADTGWPIETTEAFSRRQFVPGLGRNTPAVGAAFAAPIGTMAGPYTAGDHVVVLRVDERKPADRQLFSVMKSQLKAQLEARMAEQRAVAWLEALRQEADVIDHRDRLTQPGEAPPATSPFL